MFAGLRKIALTIRQLIVPLTVAAVVTFHTGQVLAQGAFPAPLPGQAGSANDPAFPPVNGAAPQSSMSRAPVSPALGSAPMQSSSFGAAPASFPGASSSPFAAPPTQGGPPDNCMNE